MNRSRKFIPMLLVPVGLMAAVGFLSATETKAASTGCCMQRDNISDDAPWKKVSTDFDECERENQKEPDNNDNILEQIGRTWWNIQC